MAVLTQEYFDQQIGVISRRFDGVATKADLQGQTKELKAFAEEQADQGKRIINSGIVRGKTDDFE
jgi:hypothetical protein